VTEGHTNALTVAADGDWANLELDLAQTPGPVRQTARQLWPGSSVNAVTRTTQAGEVAFELESARDDGQHTLVIAPDGRLVGRQDELPIKQIPGTTMNRLKEQLGDAKLIRVSKAVFGEDVYYDLEAEKDNHNLTLSVDPAGNRIDAED